MFVYTFLKREVILLNQKSNLIEWCLTAWLIVMAELFLTIKKKFKFEQ